MTPIIFEFRPISGNKTSATEIQSIYRVLYFSTLCNPTASQLYLWKITK